jgi:type II secretory pathway pseudopilin PulG
MTMKKGLLIFLILGVALLVGANAWPDENTSQKVEELNQEVMRLYQQGRYAAALPLAERVLEIIEKALGPELFTDN